MLADDEDAAVEIENRSGKSRVLLTCDHAGNAIPRQLGTLGLNRDELERHIAWDIGALGVAMHLSRALDASLVWQRYSRLVVDSNRPLSSDELIPHTSEATTIPGNSAISEHERNARIEHIHAPYHRAIGAVLNERELAGKATTLLAIHSFTPTYLGQSRPWHIGVLYGDDARLAEPALRWLQNDAEICVGDNEPYRIDGKDHTIPEHGLKRGLPHLLFEIRQDLISDETGQRSWGERLVRLVRHLEESHPTA